MSMHQGMDLSRFTKVSSDKKTTTLRHAKGHEIKIAHGGLTPKMREEIERLPQHDQKMAKGGKVKMYADPDEPVSKDDSAPLVDPTLPESEGGAHAPAVAPLTEQEQQAADYRAYNDKVYRYSGPAPLDPQSPAPVADQPQVAAAPVAQPQAAAAPAAPPPTVSQELKIEGDAYRQDLAMGHIKPQTYADLFAKQDTLGKIGTLFGLLVGGAGAGLTHQPNAVMEMMNKQISNDFEAQKQTHSNAQNIYQLNLKHQQQLAEIKNMEINQRLAIAKNPAEIAELNSRKNLNNTEAKVKTDANSRIQLNWTALHKLTDEMKKISPTLPDGQPNPVYQKAQQQLLMLNQGVQNENYSIADRAEAAAALGAAFSGNSTSGSESDFQSNVGSLRAAGQTPLADDKVARHIPGIPGQASIPLTSQDREKVMVGMKFKNQLQRFIDWTKTHSGALNLKQRDEGQAMAAELQGTYRMAKDGGVYKEGEQGFISSIIDSTPTKFFNAIRVLPKLDAVQRESTSQLNDRLKSYGFSGDETPKKSEDKKPAANGPKEGTEKTAKDGKPIIYRNGQWNYK